MTELGASCPAGGAWAWLQLSSAQEKDRECGSLTVGIKEKGLRNLSLMRSAKMSVRHRENPLFVRLGSNLLFLELMKAVRIVSGSGL